MGTYKAVKRTFFTVAHGEFVHRNKEGNVVDTFTGIDGVLVGLRVRNNRTEPDRKYTDFELEDGGEHFVISAGLYDSVSTTILRCLAGVEDFSKKILFEVREVVGKDGKTHNNISLKQAGERLQWCDIPDVEEFDLPTGERVKSTKKREDFINEVISKIQARLGGNAAQDEGASADVDDMPEGDYKPNIQ